MTDCKTIILAWLRAHGMDGLCEPDTECGCGLDDLAPCGDGPYPHCQPAKARTLGDGEYIGDCGPGETAYFVASDTEIRVGEAVPILIDGLEGHAEKGNA